jgi:tRNA-specific 2-thiouridylase
MSELFESYLRDRSRRGAAPDGAFSGAAGGAACGDLVRISLGLAGGRVHEVTFDAEGCAASQAAGAAVAELVDDEPVLEAARIGSREVSETLGGLSPQGLHAAELAGHARAAARQRRAGPGRP